MSWPAMIFAAGFGTRMRPLTDATPKPLLRVGGQTLLDHTLDLAREAGCAPLIVNAHYLAEQVEGHLAETGIRVLTETPEILDTGGGLKAARPHLPGASTVTLNADALFFGPNPITQLLSAWREGMEALMLTVPTDRALQRTGPGDMVADAAGRLSRGPGEVFTGVHAIRLDVLDEVDATVFSLNRVWDRLIARGGLHGVSYPGTWLDVGTPAGLEAAEARLRADV